MKKNEKEIEVMSLKIYVGRCFLLGGLFVGFMGLSGYKVQCKKLKPLQHNWA